jgi:hypothetical protein
MHLPCISFSLARFERRRSARHTSRNNRSTRGAATAPQRNQYLPDQLAIQLARPLTATEKNRALHINDKGHHDAY